jgi:NAD(P)-dependent dehydrogenase (short-subunit alcohol dehydrogenase family)
MLKLQGRTAVITGGNSGIGLSIARKFVEEGAFVYITGRRQEQLDHAVNQIKTNVTAVQGDVSRAADLDRLFDQIKEEKGCLDIVVANAGVVEVVGINDIDDAHYEKVFGTNVHGVVYTVTKALPLVSNGGSIILVGSVASFRALPGCSVYCASKAAIRALARNWAIELKDRKIRVNNLSPGPIDTPIMELQAATPEGVEQLKSSFVAAVPMGRMGRSEEIADAALFLASDDSSFVTGIDLCVDGGAGQV